MLVEHKKQLESPHWKNPKNLVEFPESLFVETRGSSGDDLESILLDGKDVLEVVGSGSLRQVHYLGLQSAYEGVSLRGEPLFTQSLPNSLIGPGIKCSDYVFYSESSMVMHKILGLPRLNFVQGDDKRNSPYLRAEQKSYPQLFEDISPSEDATAMKKIIMDALVKSSEDWNHFHVGALTSIPLDNEMRKNMYLPSYSSGSSHLLLCAELHLNSKYATVMWSSEISKKDLRTNIF